MPNPAWATAPSTTVALYTVKNKLHVKATSKPTQKCLTTLEENKAPEPHKTSGSNLQNIAMTAEEQEATIRLDFYNEDTMTNETGIQDTIGQKMPNLVKPWNEHLVHPAADLLEAYDTEGFQTNCGPYWTTDHIIAIIRCVPYPLENSYSTIAALHTETAEKIENG